MTREELFQWVKREYGTEAEYPWKDSNAVLRRADNDKWYGVTYKEDKEDVRNALQAMKDKGEHYPEKLWK